MWQVLSLSVTGTRGILTPRDSQSEMIIQQQDELESVRDSQPSTPVESPTLPPGFGARSAASRGKDASSGGAEILKVAARTVCRPILKPAAILTNTLQIAF